MARRRRSERLHSDLCSIEDVAAGLVDQHAHHIGAGFQLMGSSGIWRRNDGLYTARFVYRCRTDTGSRTIAYTIRELGIV